MSAGIRSSIIEYLATAHAITGALDVQGESMSKTKYYVNLIRKNFA